MMQVFSLEFKQQRKVLSKNIWPDGDDFRKDLSNYGITGDKGGALAFV